MSHLFYLACPYSSPDKSVAANRAEAASKATAIIAEMGLVVFSPLTHSTGMLPFLSEQYHRNHGFWMKQDLAILSRCDCLLLLPLQGWRESAGVKEELDFAKKKGLPIFQIAPSDVWAAYDQPSTYNFPPFPKEYTYARDYSADKAALDTILREASRNPYGWTGAFPVRSDGVPKTE